MNRVSRANETHGEAVTDKILLVDDDANLLAAIRRRLRKKFELETARSGADGLHALNTNGPFAVVISDMRMPEMNGLQFLKQLKTSAPDTVRMMLTAIVGIAGFQLYGTVGGGIHQEGGGGLEEINAGGNVGVGVKIAVAGPLRMRLDYRVFTLRGSPQHERHQRLYAGLNLGF